MSERKQRSLWLERFDVDVLFGLPGSEGSYWTVDDDGMLGEAVEALEYPEWAGPERGCEGGPGTGYMAGYIRIEEGHDFDELWQWLEQRQVDRLAPKDEPPKQIGLVEWAKKKPGKKHRRAR
jgi:hypothetical protein